MTLEEKAAALKALASRLRAVGLEAEASALERDAEELMAVAVELRALTVGTRSANVQPVTDVEKRRARAVAKSRAATSKDPRRVAIAARWGSQAKGAKAAGCSPAALVGYLKGDYPVPRKVARVFSVDPALPANDETWPAGIVD